MKVTLSVFIGLLCGAALQVASAQSYPARPIRIIFPFAAGASSNDILGRALAQRLSDALGQQLVVDNRPGATGTIGSEMAARSAPDGYSLLLGYTGSLAISPSVYAKLGYDPVKDLAPVARFAVIPYVLVVNPSVPAASIKELIALAKARPGQLNFASSGNGSLPHLSGELLKITAQIDIVHVPYKGGALAAIDVVGGQVQMYFSGITSMLPFIKAGKLRALAVTTLNRSFLLLDVPTANESGLPGFDVSSWLGVLAPARTPELVTRRLHNEIARIVNAPDMKNFIESQGAELVLMDPVEFGASLKAEIAKWAKVVRAANVKLD